MSLKKDVWLENMRPSQCAYMCLLVDFTLPSLPEEGPDSDPVPCLSVSLARHHLPEGAYEQPVLKMNF